MSKMTPRKVWIQKLKLQPPTIWHLYSRSVHLSLYNVWSMVLDGRRGRIHQQAVKRTQLLLLLLLLLYSTLIIINCRINFVLFGFGWGKVCELVTNSDRALTGRRLSEVLVLQHFYLKIHGQWRQQWGEVSWLAGTGHQCPMSIDAALNGS